MSGFLNVNVVYFYVKNWEEAKKFYQDTLGWPVTYSDDAVGWEEYGVDGATHVAINRWDDETPLPTGGGTCTLSVMDCYKTTEILRAKGVKCEDVVSIPGVVTYGTFYDPEGNRLQFASQEPA